jgi:hypothetical protein
MTMNAGLAWLAWLNVQARLTFVDDMLGSFGGEDPARHRPRQASGIVALRRDAQYHDSLLKRISAWIQRRLVPQR